MKPEEQPSPSGPQSSLLAPALWLLIAVAAPAGLVWFSAPDPATVVESQPLPEQSQTGDFSVGPRPEQALAEHRAAMQEWLETYGWVDREGGIVRVPIADGMQAVLQQGLPAREESGGQR